MQQRKILLWCPNKLALLGRNIRERAYAGSDDYGIRTAGEPANLIVIGKIQIRRGESDAIY